uniref:Uncharacterized protein n=1 Tax=Ananas comosus var. bracteatus TaxID=296719 RepID=A0A6V7QF04_ANACO|nr:unnamed protein product [Ananas comosus var. bracteatus]
MEGPQGPDTIVIAQPLRSIDEYTIEVLIALRSHDSVKITGSDDAVPMAICVAQLVESTKKARKQFVDAWSTSSRSLDINQHSQKIRIYMERIRRQHPDPEDPYIVLNFSRNDGDFTEDVLDAVDILSAKDSVVLRGVNEGVFRAISLAQVLSDTGEPRASSSGSKKQYDTPLIIKDKGDVERPGPSSSNTEKQCEVPLADESTGNVESPGASSSDTEKQCEAPLVDKSKAGVESPRASSSDTEKQSDTHSIDKSKGDAESPGASSSNNKKQCHASAIDESKRDVESPGTSSSDIEKQCDTSSIDKNQGK